MLTILEQCGPLPNVIYYILSDLPSAHDLICVGTNIFDLYSAFSVLHVGQIEGVKHLLGGTSLRKEMVSVFDTNSILDSVSYHSPH